MTKGIAVKSGSTHVVMDSTEDEKLSVKMWEWIVERERTKVVVVMLLDILVPLLSSCCKV